MPYGPVVEALDRLLTDRPDLAAGLTEAARGELARLSIALPGSATASGEPPEPLDDDLATRVVTAVWPAFATAAEASAP